MSGVLQEWWVNDFYSERVFFSLGKQDSGQNMKIFKYMSKQGGGLISQVVVV